MEGGLFGAHRIEPGVHDAEGIDFAEDAAHAAPDAGNNGREAHIGHSTEEAGADDFFGVGEPLAMQEPIGETITMEEPLAMEAHPAEEEINPFAEATPLPVEGEEHALAGETAEGGDSWGGNWGGFSDEAAPAEGEEGAVGLGEPEEGMENINFGDITGTAAPGAMGADGTAVAVEPPKKKKRKREANPLIRIIGIVVAGLLSLPCVLLLAKFTGLKMDFLPRVDAGVDPRR